MLVEVLRFTNLLCAGMLAGEEFVIRYGVRAPVASLDPQPEIRLRQALIRRLRVLVPAIFGLAFFSGIAVTLLESVGLGFGFRCAGLLALVTFVSITLGGTVPINNATLTWDVAASPESWRLMINRWERMPSQYAKACVKRNKQAQQE